MARLDTSFYRQQGPDLVNSVEQGIRLGDIIKQRRAQNAAQEKEQAIKAAYQSGISIGPDGKPMRNMGTISKNLIDQGYAEEAFNAQEKNDQETASRNSAKSKMLIERVKNSAPFVRAANTPELWKSARPEIMAHGWAENEIPVEYDAAWSQNALLKAQPIINQHEEGWKQREFEQKDRQIEATRTNTAIAKAEKKEEKEYGLTTPYGLANTVEDAKNLKSADEIKKNFDSKLDEMILLRKNASPADKILDRDAVGRGQQLSKDLLLAYKDMAKLGVLSAADEKILNAIIPPDPLSYNSPVAAIQGQDPVLHKLTKFKEDSDKDFQNRLKNRLRQGQTVVTKKEQKKDEVTMDEHKAAYNWALANPKDPRSKGILDSTFKLVNK